MSVRVKIGRRLLFRGHPMSAHNIAGELGLDRKLVHAVLCRLMMDEFVESKSKGGMHAMWRLTSSGESWVRRFVRPSELGRTDG